MELLPKSLYELKIPYENWNKIDYCPICKNNLKKELKEIREQQECRACNLGVFNLECACYYKTLQTLFIICETCFCCKLRNNQMKCTIIKSKNICENCEKKTRRN